MKRILFLSLLFAAFVAEAGKTQEVLVLTTATTMPNTASRKAFEIKNQGPNAIYCKAGTSSGLAVGTGRKIDPDSTWAVDDADGANVYCLAATASQVSGAATMFTEVLEK